MMVDGRSDEEIKSFLTARYGDFVLYRPPLKPETYLLWFAPFIFVAGGLCAFTYIVRKRLRGLSPSVLSGKNRQRAERLLKNGIGANIAIFREQLECVTA